jgi:hypothetical protein
VLADAGLVKSTRDGRERRWALQPRKLDEASQYLERISARWEAALARLKAMVEE